jgi:hypothetical protein
VRFENNNSFHLLSKNALFYCNNGVVVVNLEVIGLDPGANPTILRIQRGKNLQRRE